MKLKKKFLYQRITGQQEADTEPPVISNCPDTVNILTTGNSSTAAWDVPTASDNSGSTPTRTSNYSPGSTFPLGTTLARYTFRETSGNTAVCSFEVVVCQQGIPTDTTPPVISGCPGDINVQAPAGATSAVAFYIEPTASDNSGAIAPSTSSHTPAGSSFPVGNTIFSYTFTVAAGNSATCSFTGINHLLGIVVDTTPLVISGCPDDITDSVTSSYTFVEWTASTATDETSEVTVEAYYRQPRLFVSNNMEPVAVTYVFSDEAGNTATCAFTISVISEYDVFSKGYFILHCMLLHN